MDFNNLDKEFNDFIGKASVYFKTLTNVGIIGWSLIGLGLILLIVALFV